MPEAVLRFKQGVGRLIRSQADRGIVMVLDPRVRTKPYGRAFLEALPECRAIEEDTGAGGWRDAGDGHEPGRT